MQHSLSFSKLAHWENKFDPPPAASLIIRAIHQHHQAQAKQEDRFFRSPDSEQTLEQNIQTAESSLDSNASSIMIKKVILRPRGALEYFSA